jgi:hypothetical protein
MTLPPALSQKDDSNPESEDQRTDESPECDETCHNTEKSSDPTLQSEREMDIFSFHIGQYIDVLDSVDRWSEAEVCSEVN